MPVPSTVRNLQDNVVTFYDPTSKQEYIWEARGDAQGRDVQQVPEDVANNVQFMRSLHMGVLKVVDASELTSVAASTPFNPNANSVAAAEALQAGDEEASIVVIDLDSEEKAHGGGADFSMGRVNTQQIQEQVEQSRGGD
jgi:hypothetical protein